MTARTERLARQWQDSLNLLLGLWLVVSPWLLGYATLDAAFWNAAILGVVIAVTAIAALVAFQQWEEWVNLVLGIWLVAAPFVLGFAAATVAMWNHVVVGLLVAVLAGFAIYSARERMSHAH